MEDSQARSCAVEPLQGASYAFEGHMGERIQRNQNHWLLTAPQANPGMLAMFYDRDRQPQRDLVPWAGEFAGKYLTSAVLCYRFTRDKRLADQIARFVAALQGAQAENGYLGPFPKDQRLIGKTANGEHDTWDLWGHYHTILGLLLWHQESGDARALKTAMGIGDLVCDTFLDTGRRVLDAGAEEMNQAISHGLCLLYQETGIERYLAMAREVERDWQTPPSGDYVRSALAGTPFYEMPKPRWESLHSVQAILTLYEITGHERYRKAFEAIWRSIRDGDRHNTGGFSSGEAATGNPYDPRPIETCCTVAWMALSVDMLRLSGDPRVADELELSTFNATLGAQSPSGRWWTYNTPMDGVRRASAHEIVFQARDGTPELNCCAVNGPRSLGMLSEWAIVQGALGLALNYYGPSTITAPMEEGGTLTLRQDTSYPLDGHIQISIRRHGPETNVSLGLRVPAWSHSTSVRVNGQPLPTPQPGSYVWLERPWKTGDKIELELDMRPRTWIGERDAAGKVSLYSGPLLLAYDRWLNTMDPDDVPSIAPQQLHLKRIDVSVPTAEPWVAYEAHAADGTRLVLCDFASAGQAGSPYRTWLPLAGT
ncbi:MAG: beta-L-arabinofuranosidase domain-containing protein [Anaerolineae bacterium]